MRRPRESAGDPGGEPLTRRAGEVKPGWLGPPQLASSSPMGPTRAPSRAGTRFLDLHWFVRSGGFELAKGPRDPCQP